MQQRRSNLTWRNHPVRSRHLTHGMRKKKYALGSGESYVVKDSDFL